MKHMRGFTLIELLITTTVMVILMTLAVAGVRSTQVNGRDAERKADAESIARGFEQRYYRQNTRVSWETKGGYPGTNEVVYAGGWNFCPQTAYNPCYVPGGFMTDLLPGTTKDSLKTPSGNNLTTTWYASDDIATRRAAIEAEVRLDKYMYEPVVSPTQGGNCWQGLCRGFRLYYWNEANNQVEVIRSKNQ